MTAMSRERILTLFIAIATISGNAVTSILFSRLPDDGYHLARGAICYLCGISVIAVLGLVGACVENGLVVSIFGVCLLLDAVFSTIPRMVIPIFALGRAPELCLPPNLLASHLYKGSTPPNTQSFMANPEENLLARSQRSQTLGRRLGEERFPLSDCLGISTLAEITICILVLTAALLQFRSAVMVRAYGRRLNTQKRRDAISAKMVEQQQTTDVELAAEVANTGADGTIDEMEPHPGGGPRTFLGHFWRTDRKIFH